MATQGTATVDFGAFPGSTHASVTVTGQAAITGSSLVEAWLFPGSGTADHSSDEHIMAAAMLDVIASDVVAGTGFTIHVVARQLPPSGLQLPGIGREHRANATAGLNTYLPPATVASVGGEEANAHYGQYNLAWVWN